MEDNISRRKSLKKEILDIVKMYNRKIHVNGSWKHNDFHFDFLRNISFSDLDLFTECLEKEEIIESKKHIENLLSKYKIKVSIHPNKLLNKISYSTAKKILIPEYLLQLYINQKKNNNSLDHKNYINAKFSLLILRKNINDRYINVVLDNNNDAILLKLYNIKLGISNEIITKNQWLKLLKNYPELAIIKYAANHITKDQIEQSIKDISLPSKEHFLIENILSKFLKICI